MSHMPGVKPNFKEEWKNMDSMQAAMAMSPL